MENFSIAEEGFDKVILYHHYFCVLATDILQKVRNRAKNDRIMN